MVSHWNAQRAKRLSTQPGEHFDTQVRGLVLRVRQSGAASWCLLYRLHGRLRRWTIAAYKDMSLADARDAAEEGRRRVAKGADPASDRRVLRAQEQARRRETIDALIEDYIERYAKKRKRRWRDDQTMLKNEVLKPWKGRPVSSVTRRDVRELIQQIADRPAPIYANRVYEVLRKVLNYAVDQEIIPFNPAARLTKPGVEAAKRPEGEREAKAYTDDEVRQIWANTEKLTPYERVPVRLGLLLAQRPGEISDMEWSELDGCWWRVPASRAKNRRSHRVYLAQQALEELATVPRIDDEPHVFAGARGKRQLAKANVIIFEGVRRREKPRHALRTTASTNMAKLGISKSDRAKVLNHTDDSGPAITDTYDEYNYDREKQRALTRWARRLQQILEQQPSSKVVRLA